jgi:DNA-binding MarR family transcriptional regulator
MSDFNDKELSVLDHVGRNSSISQRELARATGISLGLINVILKKFLRTGYLQVSQLNKRKLEYILTREGFMAVTRRTYQYATRTIRNYHQIHSQLSALLIELNDSGYDYFSIHGDGELREMIEAIAPSLFSEGQAALGEEHRNESGAVVLNLTVAPMEGDFDGEEVKVLERIG